MEYCFPTTAAHSVAINYPNALEDINILIVKEGYLNPVPVFLNGEIVINMDSVEAQVAGAVPRNLSRSMDMAFGISNADLSIRKMLLADLKLNVGPSLSSISKDELVEKVIGSRTILGNELEIHGQYIFIFQTAIIQQVKNRISRLFARLDGIPKAMDITEFQDTYF